MIVIASIKLAEDGSVHGDLRRAVLFRCKMSSVFFSTCLRPNTITTVSHTLETLKDNVVGRCTEKINKYFDIGNTRKLLHQIVRSTRTPFAMKRIAV